jgi:hypothetical protein
VSSSWLISRLAEVVGVAPPRWNMSMGPGMVATRPPARVLALGSDGGGDSMLRQSGR